MLRRNAVGGTKQLSRMRLLIVVALLITLGWWLQGSSPAPTDAPRAEPAVAAPAAAWQQPRLPHFLPVEAHDTLRLISRGGPFPHPQDGAIFGNREGHLPQRQRGYYREYTVRTPGAAHRGARRIVTGGDPPRMYYYTDDHYDSFRSFEMNP